ncbi:Fic family protein [Rhodopila sp.]|uniref:Fic family protein n=1 Tax=Rhodopila sp. TaxID=2480087 RepID=UPI003D12C4D3
MAFAIAIMRNYPFINGNKRTGYVVLELFLRLNGCRFTVGDADAGVTPRAMAAEELPDGEFIA